MKLKLQVLLLFACLCNICKGQYDFLKFPSYDTVVIEFYKSYSAPSILPIGKIVFEKRPKGWYVSTRDYGTDEVIKSEQFWSKSSSFLKLDFPKTENQAENQEELSSKLNDWGKIWYRVYPYWGYRGSDWDVIQKLKDEKELPDWLLFALGKAYANFSHNLLSDDWGFSSKEFRFTLPEGKNCLTDEQLSKYRKYSHLAIDTYKKVAAVNPDFETLVGPINIMMSNQHLTSFLNLRMYQNEEQARKELADGLYNEFYISTAKNYLNSCAPNAILFTNGDNDTYPLLYVQSQYGFRTDVLVTNISLLNASRYVSNLREKILDAEPLPISFSEEGVKDNKRQFLPIQKKLEGFSNISDIIAFVKNDTNTIQIGNDDYWYIPNDSFRLTCDAGVIEWALKDRKYIFRNDLLLLDILANNKLTRPAYFTITTGSDAFLGLENYFQMEGLAYRITTTNHPLIDNATHINTGKMYDNFMNRFVYDGINKVPFNDKSFFEMYRNIAGKLALALISENKHDSAEKVLDRSIELFPNDALYFDYFILETVDGYFQLNRPKKANGIVRILIHNLKDNIQPYYNKDYNISSITEDDVISKLKEILKKYHQEEMLKQL